MALQMLHYNPDVIVSYNFLKVYDVMSCLRHFGALIHICLDKKYAVISQPWNSVEIETVFPLLGSLTSMSIRFICMTVPYEKVGTALVGISFVIT